MGDHLTRTTPIGVKIDDRGLVSLELPLFVGLVVKDLVDKSIFGKLLGHSQLLIIV